MKKLILPVFVLLMAFSFSISAQEKAHNNNAHAKKTVAAVDSKPFNKVCPVSGEELEDTKNTAVYNGKTYALCCRKCLAKFEKNPEKYADNLNEDGTKFKKN